MRLEININNKMIYLKIRKIIRLTNEHDMLKKRNKLKFTKQISVKCHFKEYPLATNVLKKMSSSFL